MVSESSLMGYNGFINANIHEVMGYAGSQCIYSALSGCIRLGSPAVSMIRTLPLRPNGNDTLYTLGLMDPYD